MENKIPGRQLSAWLMVASIAPVVCIVGHNSWLTVLLTAVACTALSLCVLTCSQEHWPRWLRVVELAWLIALLAGLARVSGSSWEDANAFPSIPIILLLLAAFAAQRGAIRTSRAGATLVWLVLPVLGIVALAGTVDANVQWVRMGLEVPDGMLVTLLLLPCLAAFLPREKSKAGKSAAIVLGVAAVAAAVLMDMTLGATVAQSAENSFYTFSKGVNLFGVAERFEPLVACVLTAGWFAGFSLILCAIYHLAEEIFFPAAKWSVWIAAAAAGGLMCILPNSGYWMAIGALIFWGFLPVAAQGIGGIKNIGKK